jgi:hypothetical protein
MTIHYQDGRAVEAAILSLREDVVRLAVKGADDSEVFRKIGDRWISEDCTPVVLRFGRHQAGAPATFTEADFICPAEFASRLVRLLLYPDESGDERRPEPIIQAGMPAVV